MMRLTQLLAVSARRVAASGKLAKNPALGVALSPKKNSFHSAPLTSLVKTMGSEKKATPSFVFRGKKSTTATKAAARPKKLTKPSKRKLAQLRGRKSSSLYVRFYHALRKEGCVKGKRVMQKTGELWRATKNVEDFQKRVERAIKLAAQKKTKAGKRAKSLKKKNTKGSKSFSKKKESKPKSTVRKAYRRVAKKKTPLTAVPPLP